MVLFVIHPVERETEGGYVQKEDSMKERLSVVDLYWGILIHSNDIF